MRTILEICILLTIVNSISAVLPGYPVILVPGDGGSQLQVKVNKKSVPHFFCDKHTDKFNTIWLSVAELVPGITDCFVDNMRLVYNRTTHKSANVEGVEFRVPGWGETSSVEWLNPTLHLSILGYYNKIVEKLVSAGYKRGVSVRGAPYDFRRAPNEYEDFYDRFQMLVEETYTQNNDTKVVIVGHSMGNPVMLYFLNSLPQVWKDKYVQSFVSLAGVWGGVIKTLKAFASGDNLGISSVQPLTVRKEQRTMTSSSFMMPSDQFWNASEILVYTEKRNYTVKDYEAFFKDLGHIDGYYMRKDTENLIKDLTPPGVPVHCLHGVGLATPANLRYGPGKFPDSEPQTDIDDGDGTVNIRSLLGCTRWQTQQTQSVFHKTVPKAEHRAILNDPSVCQYVLDVALGKK